VYADSAACGPDDFGPLGRHARSQHRLAEERRLCRRSGGTAEVHAQVAMPNVVPTLAQTVRRIGAQGYDEREGRDERDQAIAARTRAQGRKTPSVGRTSLACARSSGNSHDETPGMSDNESPVIKGSDGHRRPNAPHLTNLM
jgi:hypothetical protein